MYYGFVNFTMWYSLVYHSEFRSGTIQKKNHQDQSHQKMTTLLHSVGPKAEVLRPKPKI